MRYFGTDGIRDRAGQGGLSDDNVARAGRALARFAAGRRADGGTVRIVLARDPRPSGPGIAAALAAQMTAEGAQVVDAGVIPTPALAWLTAEDGYDLGCMVSASHNPPEYNGIKPFVDDARKLTDDQEREIEALMGEVDASVLAAATGEAQHMDDAARRYVTRTVALLAPGGDLDGVRLALDLAAGATSTTAVAVLEGLGAHVEPMHEMGSRAINDACGSEHPERWLDRLRRGEGFDGGLAFDGDGDRVVIADETGAALDGDDMLSILAAAMHAAGGIPADTIVSTVMANLGLEEFLGRFDVRLLRAAVGDRHVAEAMRAHGAGAGGEPSGHVVLPQPDLGGALIGDAVVAGVRVLQAAQRLGEPLSVLRARRPRYPQKLVNVRMETRRDLDTWPEMQEALAAETEALGDRGRIVLRYSGTEPLLRIMVEAKAEDDMLRALAGLESAATA